MAEKGLNSISHKYLVYSLALKENYKIIGSVIRCEQKLTTQVVQGRAVTTPLKFTKTIFEGCKQKREAAVLRVLVRSEYIARRPQVHSYV